MFWLPVLFFSFSILVLGSKPNQSLRVLSSKSKPFVLIFKEFMALSPKLLDKCTKQFHKNGWKQNLKSVEEKLFFAFLDRFLSLKIFFM
jgi:hypothetical protein